jgi:hypothetical protein
MVIRISFLGSLPNKVEIAACLGLGLSPAWRQMDELDDL